MLQAALFALLAVLFALFAFSAGRAGQLVIAVAALGMALWMGDLAYRWGRGVLRRRRTRTGNGADERR